MADYPVTIYCPIRGVEEKVFFHPIEHEGQWYVDINSFNGCDIGWSACKECEDCKIKAYQMILNKP